MYEAFYGFKEKPFSMLPDPGFLFLSKKHRAALTLLEYGVLNQAGFCVITGEAGAGKTTILRALLERVGNTVTIGLITNTHQSFGGLLDWVLSAYDLHQPNLSHVEMHQLFMEFLIKEYADGHTVLLIVDEAQNMNPDALEELRMLSNVNSEKDQLMQVVLAGQPSLKETLRKPELMQFAQRIAVDYHLEQLNVVETCGYIQHRLVTAGAERDIFTPAACERIHTYSGGTPRLINLLCETVLVYGFADQEEMIDVALVDEMVQERMKDSVVPIVNRDAAVTDNKRAALELEKDFPWIQSQDGAQNLEADVKVPLVVKPQAEDIEQELAVTAVEPTAVIKAVAVEAANDESVSYGSSGKKTELKKPVIKDEIKNPAQTTEKTVDQDVTPPTLSPSSDAKVKKAGSAKSLLKYGVLAGIILLLLIGGALYLSAEIETPALPKKMVEPKAAESKVIETKAATEAMLNNEADKKRILALQQKRAEDEARVKRLQLEAEKLKKERDAAIAKAAEEKRAKQQAEKQAAEKAELAARAAKKKRQLAEKKRLAAVKARERQAKLREAKLKVDAEKMKLEAARLAEEKRLMGARMEKEKRLAHEQELRRLEREIKERQRQELAAEKIRAEEQALADAAAKAKFEEESKTSECRGPTARFKSSCR